MLNGKRNFGQVASKMFDMIEHIPDAKEETVEENASRQYQVDTQAFRPSTADSIPPTPPDMPEASAVPPPRVTTAPAMASVFAEDLVIEGRIVAKGDIEMRGKLEGDLVTTGNVSVSGVITGDLSGCNIHIAHGAVKGNIVAEQSIEVDQESLIVGDISAHNLRSSGYVKGNLSVKNKTVLVSGSCLVGDVETNSIMLEEGAVLAGSVHMNCGNTDDIFPKEGEELKLRRKIDLGGAPRARIGSEA